MKELFCSVNAQVYNNNFNYLSILYSLRLFYAMRSVFATKFLLYYAY